MHSCRGQDDGDVRPMAHTRGDFRRSQRPISRSTRARHLYIYYRSRSHLHVVSSFPCSRRDVFLACLHNEADPGEYRMASSNNWQVWWSAWIERLRPSRLDRYAVSREAYTLHHQLDLFSVRGARFWSF